MTSAKTGKLVEFQGQIPNVRCIFDSTYTWTSTRENLVLGHQPDKKKWKSQIHKINKNRAYEVMLGTYEEEEFYKGNQLFRKNATILQNIRLKKKILVSKITLIYRGLYK